MTRMPQVTAAELVRFFRSKGFVERRQRSSPLIMVHPQSGRRPVIPMHRGDLGRWMAATILDQAGFTVDEYLRLR